MALARGKDRVKKERRGLYMDIILGIISSILAICGLIFVAILKLIKNIGWYIFGFSFWICWLLFSFVLIGIGIYTWQKEKHFDEREPRKDLKPPIM